MSLFHAWILKGWESFFRKKLVSVNAKHVPLQSPLRSFESLLNSIHDNVKSTNNINFREKFFHCTAAMWLTAHHFTRRTENIDGFSGCCCFVIFVFLVCLFVYFILFSFPWLCIRPHSWLSAWSLFSLSSAEKLKVL